MVSLGAVCILAGGVGTGYGNILEGGSSDVGLHCGAGPSLGGGVSHGSGAGLGDGGVVELKHTIVGLHCALNGNNVAHCKAVLFLVGPTEAGSIFEDGTLGIGCNNGCTLHLVVAGSGNLVQSYCTCGSLGLGRTAATCHALNGAVGEFHTTHNGTGCATVLVAFGLGGEGVVGRELNL